MKTINLDDPNLVLSPALQPDCRPLQGLPVFYRLFDDPMRYVLRGQNVDIPFGFQDDLMSVPGPVRSISGLEQDGPHRAADLFHDWAYSHQGVMPGTTLVLTRGECDDIHKLLCLAGGMTPEKCDTIHFMLTLFGGIAWNHYTPAVPGLTMTFDRYTLTWDDLVQYKLLHP